MHFGETFSSWVYNQGSIKDKERHVCFSGVYFFLQDLHLIDYLFKFDQYNQQNHLDNFSKFIFRGVYSKKLLVSIKTRSCLKSEHYAEAVATPEDNSHYQELGVSGGRNPYLNTTIN